MGNRFFITLENHSDEYISAHVLIQSEGIVGTTFNTTITLYAFSIVYNRESVSEAERICWAHLQAFFTSSTGIRVESGLGAECLGKPALKTDVSVKGLPQ